MTGQRGSRLLPLFQHYSVGSIIRCQSCHAFSSDSSGSSGRVAVLQSRGVLQAEGSQALGFLQGMVTNDVRPLESAGSQQAPVYAAILTPKGKFLHDIFIYPHPDVRDAVLIDVDRSGAAAALQLLNRYKLRRPITFCDATSDYSVVAAWGSSSQPPGSWWRPDPRLRELGFRGLLPVSEVSMLTSTGTAASEDEYRALRYSLGVAEGESEIPAGQAAPLDYNLDALNGVSYTKGCYVGQERNSFTHYRGVIRKRLMPVRLEARGSAEVPAGPKHGEASVAGQPEGGSMAGPGPSSTAGLPALGLAGADVTDAASGRSVGQIRGTAAGSSGAGAEAGVVWGIAYLKLGSALPAAEGRVELLVATASGRGAGPGGAEEGKATVGEAGQAGGGGSAGARTVAMSGAVVGQDAVADGGATALRVVPSRPAWWPSEWGREEATGTGGTSRP